MTHQALQAEIDKVVERDACGVIEAITLGPDCEVSDLDANVSVRVRATGQREREFTVLSADWVGELFAPGPSTQVASEKVYVVGGPLAIVGKISAASIVRTVLRYLELERRRKEAR